MSVCVAGRAELQGKVELLTELYRRRVKTVGSHSGLRDPPLLPPAVQVSHGALSPQKTARGATLWCVAKITVKFGGGELFSLPPRGVYTKH